MTETAYFEQPLAVGRAIFDRLNFTVLLRLKRAKFARTTARQFAGFDMLQGQWLYRYPA